MRRQTRPLHVATSRRQLATLTTSPQPLATLLPAHDTVPACTRHSTSDRAPATIQPPATHRTTTAGRVLKAAKRVRRHAWPGNPHAAAFPLRWPGNPQHSSLSSRHERQAIPLTAFTQSARQSRSGSSLPCFDSARQSQSPSVSESRPASRWTLIPVDLPRRTPPRPVKPWYSGEEPIDPRGRTPSPTPDPADRGTCWDPCPDREIQDLLQAQLRPVPLLSPLRDPYPDLDVEELLQGQLRPVPLLSPLRDPCPDPDLEDILKGLCRLAPPLSPL